MKIVYCLEKCACTTLTICWRTDRAREYVYFAAHQVFILSIFQKKTSREYVRYEMFHLLVHVIAITICLFTKYRNDISLSKCVPSHPVTVANSTFIKFGSNLYIVQRANDGQLSNLIDLIIFNIDRFVVWPTHHFTFWTNVSGGFFVCMCLMVCENICSFTYIDWISS